MTFYQDPPLLLENQFLADKFLYSYLQRFIPDDFKKEIFTDLENFGKRVITDIYELSIQANNEEPKLINYDPWGKRIDFIKVSDAWKKLHNVSANEGIIAIAYERKFKEFSRLYQMSKLYLFHPSSAVYSCPLAMTDGAARLIEVYGDTYLKNKIYQNLITRNENEFWTSGQWMTERIGGSDVSNTETTAIHKKDKYYLLYGDKWFTSATTSEIAFTLAKIKDNNSLSLFYLETKNNNIMINRLKNKLGTKALPTAELTLNGAKSLLVGEIGKGVKQISVLFNITRIYNAVCSIALMRRAIALVYDYSKKRKSFNKKIIEHPLHLKTINDMEKIFQYCFLTTFYTVFLLGKEENNIANSDEKKLLRLLTPIIKLYTAKKCIEIVSECLECFGGAGYIEDTGLPVLLRDAQVLSIWEGTTNVLSLDVLRALLKDDSLPIFTDKINKILSKIPNNFMIEEKANVINMLENINNFYIKNISNKEVMESEARNFSFSLFKIISSALFIEHNYYLSKNDL